MKVSFYMLLYRAFHAQRKCLRPFMAELGLAPGQPTDQLLRFLQLLL